MRLTPVLASMGFTTLAPNGAATDYDRLIDPAGKEVGFLRDAYMGVTRGSLRGVMVALPNAKPVGAYVGFPRDGYSEVRAAREIVRSLS